MGQDNDNPISRPHGEWLERWEENAIGWHHQEFNPHLLGFWEHLNVTPGAQVLVPLCGKSRDLVWLSGHGYRTLGVELSPIAVKAFFREQELTPHVEAQGSFDRWEADQYEILCGDIFELDRANAASVAAVYDRASLVALNLDQRRHYAKLLKWILPAGCSILLVAMEYPQQEMEGPPYSVGEAEIRKLYAPEYSISLLHSLDLLKDTARYSNRGLSYLWERVYLLQQS